MPNVKAIVEYDGTDFCGFQIQPSVITIQGELERVLRKLNQGEAVRVIGAGRTDAGVHATGQVVNFEAGEFPIDRLCPAMNGLLPRSIRVKAVEEVPAEFNARYSAKARTYIYVVLNRAVPSALLARYAWQIIQPLDIEVMREAASGFIGSHDFASFGMPDKVGKCTVRQVFDFAIGRRKDAFLFKIRANAFLRGMARAMVGTLVEIGQGKHRPVVRASTDIIGPRTARPERILEILQTLDRQAAGRSAPPEGLYLTRVEY